MLDYETLLQPDPALRALLASIPVPKYILTNADAVHTQRCLARLGIADCFQAKPHCACDCLPFRYAVLKPRVCCFETPRMLPWLTECHGPRCAHHPQPLAKLRRCAVADAVLPSEAVLLSRSQSAAIRNY